MSDSRVNYYGLREIISFFHRQDLRQLSSVSKSFWYLIGTDFHHKPYLVIREFTWNPFLIINRGQHVETDNKYFVNNAAHFSQKIAVPETTFQQIPHCLWLRFKIVNIDGVSTEEPDPILFEAISHIWTDGVLQIVWERSSGLLRTSYESAFLNLDNRFIRALGNCRRLEVNMAGSICSLEQFLSGQYDVLCIADGFGCDDYEFPTAKIVEFLFGSRKEPRQLFIQTTETLDSEQRHDLRQSVLSELNASSCELAFRFVWIVSNFAQTLGIPNTEIPSGKIVRFVDAENVLAFQTGGN
ncbi:hypothetical protein DdX_18046 [Ditylenchus destructor]|uniref:F-box domain-containing protein n=1 Tax=Ditylenchus destructor TaxID=166010 RepID=A0AAD4MLF8_9BILA|nr:hypothetical protein DdX_18046 [Ditylenchus destructor]